MRLWNPKDKTDMVDIALGLHVIRFEWEKDYMHVLLGLGEGGLGRCLIITWWYRDGYGKVNEDAMWVRLLGLPIEYLGMMSLN